MTLILLAILVQDGELVRIPFEDGTVSQPSLGAGGTAAMCRVRRIQNDQRGFYIVSTFGQAGPFEEVGDFQWSVDGKTLAYWANAGEQQFAYVGNTRLPQTYVRGNTLKLSSDGKTVAYALIDREKGVEQVVVGDKVLSNARQVALSPDGRRFAYVVRSEGKERWVFEDKTGAPFNWISAITFSPDGSKFAFTATVGPGQQVVVVDGVKGETHANVGTPVFNRDGSVVDYKGGTWLREVMVVNGRKGSPWLRSALVEAAWAASRTKTIYFRAQFIRIRSHRGPKKAVVAVAHSILVVLYHMLRDRVAYREHGAEHFDHISRVATRRRLVRRLQQLGCDVTLQENKHAG